MDRIAGGDLILRVRALIEAGALPATNSRPVWAGTGDGSPCRICANPISPEQFEFELDGVRLHRYCCDIWLQDVGTSQSPPRAIPASGRVRPASSTQDAAGRLAAWAGQVLWYHTEPSLT